MRWQGRRQSDNVEDRRRVSGKQMGIGGGVVGVVVLLIAVMLGADPQALLQMAEQQQAVQGPADTPENDELSQFVRTVLADTEDVWREQFQKMGKTYREPGLVLFTDGVQSACGQQSSAVGPFYCPLDQKIYIDLDFYRELRSRFNAPGDFAQAYVIAHEVGHHVQHLLGTSDKVHQLRQRASESQANELSVRLELQADFLAGVWAHHAEKTWQILEAGDVEEALNAASAIGDDSIQKKTQGYIVPESFTHGTSSQRMMWFRKGLMTGDPAQGDTFSTKSL